MMVLRGTVRGGPRMKLAVVSLIAATLALGAGAGSTAPPPDPVAPAAPDHAVNTTATARNVEGGCFRSNLIDTHSMVDDHTMYLSVRTRGVYRITFTGACLAGAVSSDTIIIRHLSGNNLV